MAFLRRPKPTAPLHPFDLDRPLLGLSPADAWRIRDACEGTQIFGAIGSGKTSGSGQAIAKSFLSAGFGGLVLTAKPDERALWERYCAQTGRSDSLIVFSPEQPWRFNFLDYELRRPGRGAGETENLVRLFHTILETVDGGKGAGKDPFWERAVKQMLRNAIEVAKAATGRLVLAEIAELIATAPSSIEETHAERWQSGSFCY